MVIALDKRETSARNERRPISIKMLAFASATRTVCTPPSHMLDVIDRPIP